MSPSDNTQDTSEDSGSATSRDSTARVHLRVQCNDLGYGDQVFVVLMHSDSDADSSTAGKVRQFQCSNSVCCYAYLSLRAATLDFSTLYV